MAEDIKQAIRQLILASGACAAGFAESTEIEPRYADAYSRWIERGSHGEMTYLDRYHDIRRDPRLLLEGTQTVISCAFDYRPAAHHSLFADYALGRDYHDVIRDHLTPVADEICQRFGGETRICVDTAPIRERYWAARAGIGVLGLNGLLIVEGVGSKVFLAEILWTGKVSPDASRLGESCMRCGACLKACPGHALTGDGTLDARQCNSYLTIEFRGEWPDELSLPGRIYGCYICHDVCPHKRLTGATEIEEFKPSEAMMQLDIDTLRHLTPESYRELFRGSAIRRAKLPMLLRNAAKHPQ